MAAAVHRAAPLRGAMWSRGWGGGAFWVGCQVPVSPRWVPGAGGVRHGPEREAGAMSGTRHLLVPITPQRSGDPRALSQLGQPGPAQPHCGASQAMPPPQGAGLWEREVYPMPSHPWHLHRTCRLGPGQGLPWLAPGRALSCSGERGARRRAPGWAGAGAGPADKALLCRAGAAGSPINSRIMLGGGPPSLPSCRRSAGAPWEAI